MMVIGGGALLIVAIVVAVAPRLWAAANAHSEDPVALLQFAPLAQSTYVYDADGNQIAIFELENSQPISYVDIPTDAIQAFLLVEDKEFFTHDGVNVRSLFRATLSNFASDAPQQGASTITMQVAKNEFLAGLERDGRYKLLQIQYAKRLEKEMSKEAILERYLNTVFFGNNAYGLQAAAETYFGISASELNFQQAAFLAGLVRSPSGFDPINQVERSRARWVQVIDRLVSEGILTEAQSLDWETNFALPERNRATASRATARTYFTEALRDYLLNESDILGATPEERSNNLFRGGLRIHTTLKPNMQAAGERAQAALPPTAEGFEAALVSVDSTSGAIRAMVGGRGFQPQIAETNMALSPRQTGSSIKFFVLAAAIQAGAQSGDTIDGRVGCKLPNPGDPNNPVFPIEGGVNGAIANLRDTTARSFNCGFARLSQIVGLNRVVDTTYRMADSVYLNRQRADRQLLPVASFATGANEMSPLDMASGLQTLANEGNHKQPYYVEYIDDAAGNRLHTHFDPGQPVLDRDAALETIDIMKGTITYGTADVEAPLADGREAFGKTGTQQDNTNAWFVGGTKQLSTAVWVGNPDAYTKMINIEGFEFSKVRGGDYPARIWRLFMEEAHFGLPLEDWDDPAPPERPNARLVLPGNECEYVVIGRSGGVPVATTPGAAPADAPVVGAGQQVDPNAPATTAAPGATTAPVQTTPVVVITAVSDIGTTISPDNLDPKAPLPSVAIGRNITSCR
jgi:penicillin-binding protein 1A